MVLWSCLSDEYFNHFHSNCAQPTNIRMEPLITQPFRWTKMKQNASRLNAFQMKYTLNSVVAYAAFFGILLQRVSFFFFSAVLTFRKINAPSVGFLIYKPLNKKNHIQVFAVEVDVSRWRMCLLKWDWYIFERFMKHAIFYH